MFAHLIWTTVLGVAIMLISYRAVNPNSPFWIIVIAGFLLGAFVGEVRDE